MLLTLGYLEFIRGVHSLVVMNSLRGNQYSRLKHVTLAQLIIGLGAQPLAIHFIGLWGSIICSSIIDWNSLHFSAVKRLKTTSGHRKTSFETVEDSIHGLGAEGASNTVIRADASGDSKFKLSIRATSRAC